MLRKIQNLFISSVKQAVIASEVNNSMELFPIQNSNAAKIDGIKSYKRLEILIRELEADLQKLLNNLYNKSLPEVEVLMIRTCISNHKTNIANLNLIKQKVREQAQELLESVAHISDIELQAKATQFLKQQIYSCNSFCNDSIKFLFLDRI